VKKQNGSHIICHVKPKLCFILHTGVLSGFSYEGSAKWRAKSTWVWTPGMTYWCLALSKNLKPHVPRIHSHADVKIHPKSQAWAPSLTTDYKLPVPNYWVLGILAATFHQFTMKLTLLQPDTQGNWNVSH
jgi:hypothetical protein